jgi:hypothetical protein
MINILITLSVTTNDQAATLGMSSQDVMNVHAQSNIDVAFETYRMKKKLSLRNSRCLIAIVIIQSPLSTTDDRLP